EGFYMIRQKWANDKFVTSDSSALDTVPLYFAKAQGDFPFRWGSLMFSYPINMEMILKFRYLRDDTVAAKTERSIPQGVDLKNYRDKLSDNIPIAERYDTAFIDSVLRVELASNSIHDKFHFGFIRNSNRNVEYRSAGADLNALQASPLHVLLTSDKYFSQPYD